MKLKKKSSNLIEKEIMTAYELLCLYGESFTRTLGWMIAAILIATISIFAFLKMPILDSLMISIAAFFQLYFNNHPVIIIERLISIAILGSFYITLKRKLERRLRH